MFLIWNVRRAAKRHFARSIRDLVRLHHIQVLAILEPQISGDRALATINRLGFDHYYVVDAYGFLGGLWFLWHDLEVHFQIVECSHHSITALIAHNTHKWLFTTVYANPSASLRKNLWPYLH